MVRYSIKTTACLTAGALTLLATPAKAAPPGEWKSPRSGFQVSKSLRMS